MVPAILLIIFGKFTKFQQSFHSPQVKRNLISNIRNFMGRSLVPSLFCRNNVLALVLKKQAETERKIYRFCLTLLDFLIFFKIFCTGLYTNSNMRKPIIMLLLSVLDQQYPFQNYCSQIIKVVISFSLKSGSRLPKKLILFVSMKDL